MTTPARPGRMPAEVVLYDGASETPTDVVDVSSGEIVSLSSDTDTLTALRVHLIGVKNSIDLINRAIDVEVLRRMDKDLHWTHKSAASGVKASAPSPDPKLVVNKPEELNKLLQRMLDEDEITPDAKYAAVEPEPITYKVKISGVKALLKRPDLKDRLMTVCDYVDKTRRVTYS